jgi:molybdopterin-guanine dinucleotide biosynthesis protein A
MPKDEKTLISIYADRALKEALEKQAEKENRSLSNLLVTILEDYATKKA